MGDCCLTSDSESVLLFVVCTWEAEDGVAELRKRNLDYWSYLRGWHVILGAMLDNHLERKARAQAHYHLEAEVFQ